MKNKTPENQYLIKDTNETDLNKRIQKYYSDRNFESIHLNPTDKSLIAFFLQLSRYLQQTIETVAAIDFSAYATSLGIRIDKEL